jgi:hypothetical protein
MKQAARCAAAAWALLGVGLLAGPGSAGAQHGTHHGGSVQSPATAPPAFVAAPVSPRPPSALRPSGPGNQHPLPHPPFRHGGSSSPVVGIPVYVPSDVPGAIPDQYAWPSPYDLTMVDAAPPASVLSAPPEPIEYPTGRYELRGDGVTAPYQWVWVPNPPPGPPAPPPAAPGGQAQTTAPSVAPATPPLHADVYRFTDEQGVVTWTDRWDSIPERYRSQARRLPL